MMLKFVSHIGHAALASLFILGSISKLIDYSATSARMTEAGLWPSELLLPLTIGLEFFGGLLVLVGRRSAVPACFALAAFTIATNIVFHRFWEMSGDLADLERSLFFKNIAIAGGLIAVAAAHIRTHSAKDLP